MLSVSHKYRLVRTPDGVIAARVYEVYIGLKGQPRVGFVDKHGRVFHYDLSQVRDLHWEQDVQVIPGF